MAEGILMPPAAPNAKTTLSSLVTITGAIAVLGRSPGFCGPVLR